MRDIIAHQPYEVMRMAYEFGFLFGKTIMKPQDLDRWLKVEKFADGIRSLVESNKAIGDVEILRLAESILNEDLNSDSICGVNREKLVESVTDLRMRVDKYTFKPAWMRERYPSLWRTIKDKMRDENLDILPIQMSRLNQVLKYVTNLKDNGVAEVFVYGLDEQNTCHITISFERLSVVGAKQIDELFGRLRFCDSLDIEINDGKVEVAITVPDLMIKADELASMRQLNKAWVLRWNQDLKSKMNQGDD